MTQFIIRNVFFFLFKYFSPLLAFSLYLSCFFVVARIAYCFFVFYVKCFTLMKHFVIDQSHINSEFIYNKLNVALNTNKTIGDLC